MKFSDHLKKWFLENRRSFPWRENATPYAVWVSEVMLQQTQASVVVPYFEKWMAKYPTVIDLASAPLDEVIKNWEGLGYYTRARNLHEGARQVVRDYGGELPQDPEELRKIKGIGPYTLGAILSFAFKKKAPAVDGNVVRVLSRYFQVEEDISSVKTMKKLWAIAKKTLPDDEPWVIAEALIELGATICARKPRCFSCPLKTTCRSFSNGVESRLPYKSAKTQITHLYRLVAVISYKEKLLVRRGKTGEIMSDLYEFLYIDVEEKPTLEDMTAKIQKVCNFEIKLNALLSEESHSFTRYRVRLYPALYNVNQQIDIPEFEWKTLEELENLAFSSGHRKILKQLLNTISL